MPSRISRRPRLTHDGSVRVRMRKNGIDVDVDAIIDYPVRNEARLVSESNTGAVGAGADEGSLCDPPSSLSYAKDAPSAFDTVSQRISQLMEEDTPMKKPPPPRTREFPTQPRRAILLEPTADVTSSSFDTSRDVSPESSPIEVLSEKNCNNKRQHQQEDKAFPLLSQKKMRMANEKAEHIFSTRLAESAPTKIEEMNAYKTIEQKELESTLEFVHLEKRQVPLVLGIYPKPDEDESPRVCVEFKLNKEPQKVENVAASEHKEIMTEQPLSTKDSFEEKARDKESIVLVEESSNMNENECESEYKKSPAKTRTKVRWGIMIDYLKAYIEEHGDANVPQREGPLGRWVNNQRAFFSRFEKGKEHPPFGIENVAEWKEKIQTRKDTLNELGLFDWRHQPETKWNNMLQELVKFKEEHGHTNVPQRKNALGQWVNTQRKNLVYREKGKRSHITQERMDMLNKIGFDWVQDKETQWDEKLNELIEYKRVHGHSNVPRSQGSLGMWVRRQRRSYKLISRGENSPLTEERIYALDAMGFEWTRAWPKKKTTRSDTQEVDSTCLLSEGTCANESHPPNYPSGNIAHHAMSTM